MSDEVAVLIDFENLRYGLLNQYGMEPEIGVVVKKAQKYGRPTIMRAYADFSEHPADLARKLQVAGVEAITSPVKRKIRGGVERIQNAADMVLALDAVMVALDADASGQVKTFLLVTGDADYIKLVTMLRNRFGQKVIICGVPGGISNDLVAAADGEDHLEISETPPTDLVIVKAAIVSMVRKGPAPLVYWSAKIIDQWARDERHGVPGTAKEKRDAIGELLREQVLKQRSFRDERRSRDTTETYLDDDRAHAVGYE